MKLAFIIDPIETLDPGHDSSVAMMEAAQLLGHEIWIATLKDLYIKKSKAWAKLTPVTLTPVRLEQGKWVSESVWFELGEPCWRCLEEMDSVWMRKDPPVDTPYLYATYILSLINPEYTFVCNNPQGIRSANEKLYALHFPSIIPETLVSCDKEVIKSFIKEQKTAVIKPLGGKGGEGILFVEEDDRNINSLIEISTKQGQEPIMVQTYLPSAKEGDKRIILLNGKAIGAVNRVPTGDDFRGNMAVGGVAEGTEITDREQEICRTVAPKLLEDGLYFVGLDIIGGYLTEVNVTSPTGLREIDRLNNTCLGKQVIQWLETIKN